MSEWWSYRPSDFLMFSPRVYYRQIQSFNADHWPLHLVLAVVGVYLTFAAIRRRPLDVRAAYLLLAALWVFVAADYLRTYLSTIHWGATYATYAFLVQAFLLVVCGIIVAPADQGARGIGQPVGVALILAATALYPLVAVFAGRGFAGAEVIGAMPTPTALATLGFLTASQVRVSGYALMTIPVLWCFLDSVTAHSMRQADWWISPSLAALAVATAVGERLLRSRPS